MTNNILLCGVGGQGIVLTSKLTASAAMDKGYHVMSAETIGMAQKGGSVFSFLRIGNEMYSPMFGRKQADIIIAFEPAEAVRMLPYLSDSGCVIVNTHPVMPVTAVLKESSYNGEEMMNYLKGCVNDLVIVDGAKACRDLGSPKVLNMVMLGAAIRSGFLPFTIGDAERAMEKNVKSQFVELNKKALNYIS
ncbi:MAG TPA: indolepyruvate oxidoreductase subunit beta [Ruminococcus sp.]|nr:indolepyruvate oxidoreductase subunit beta [Ruminococcus sp.]